MSLSPAVISFTFAFDSFSASVKFRLKVNAVWFTLLFQCWFHTYWLFFIALNFLCTKLLVSCLFASKSVRRSRERRYGGAAVLFQVPSDKWNTMIESLRFRYEWDLPFCLNNNAIQHAMTYGSFNRGLNLAFSVRVALGLVRVATKLSMIQHDIVVHTTTTSSSHHHQFSFVTIK